MGSFVMAEYEVEESALCLQEALLIMQSACEELSLVFTQLTCPGGGLESSKMQAALTSRSSDINTIGQALSAMSKAVISETGNFIDAVKTLDSSGLTIQS